MTASWWVLVMCLAAGACVVAWPSRGSRGRLVPRQPGRRLPDFDLGVVRRELAERPRRSVALVAVGGATVGWLISGVVAGLLAAVYGALGARALVRRSARRQAVALREQTLDDLGALAADLRAGLPPVEAAFSARSSVMSGSVAVPATRGFPGSDGHEAPGMAEGRIGELTAAVWRLAERTGAPAADLVDRIEADARTADRAHALASAQAAGAQATAVILTGLPIGGILLGYGIGVAPLPILLHTMLGGACALGAALLQSLGLLWAERLTAGAAR